MSLQNEISIVHVNLVAPLSRIAKYEDDALYVPALRGKHVMALSEEAKLTRRSSSPLMPKIEQYVSGVQCKYDDRCRCLLTCRPLNMEHVNVHVHGLFFPDGIAGGEPPTELRRSSALLFFFHVTRGTAGEAFLVAERTRGHSRA